MTVAESDGVAAPTLIEITRLVAAAARHDQGEPDRLRRWRVLEPEAGRLLWFLAVQARARSIVEIGTSRGVSTLWLADAAQHTDGSVVSVDTDHVGQLEAAASLATAGLADRVVLQVADGGRALAELPDNSVDLLFLDAERHEYPGWWPHPIRVLRPGGLLVVDNATSHPEEIADLRQLLAEAPDVLSTVIDIGKGELVAIRQ